MNKYYRYPKSTRIIAMNAKNAPFARAKLRATPTEYSDLTRSDVLSKSWKDNKKSKQYM